MELLPLVLVFFLVQSGAEVFADSDFFESSSVPADLIAGSRSKEKTEPAPTTTAEEPTRTAPSSSSVTRPAANNVVNPLDGGKKKDMPREVFVEWIGGGDEASGAGGTDLDETQIRKPANGASTNGTPPKRGASGSRNIDDLLENELRKSGEKVDVDDDAENRFIEVN